MGLMAGTGGSSSLTGLELPNHLFERRELVLRMLDARLLLDRKELVVLVVVIEAVRL